MPSPRHLRAPARRWVPRSAPLRGLPEDDEREEIARHLVRIDELESLRALAQEAVDEGGLPGAVRPGEADEGGHPNGQLRLDRQRRMSESGRTASIANVCSCFVRGSSGQMLKASLSGQVRQTSLPKWKPLLPLFEAVMNALQATQDGARSEPVIRIDIVRDDRALLTEETPPITGFRITDYGIGLNDDNFDSFNTAFSEHKLARGGKGLGRFIWLKAFESVSIRSRFNEGDDQGTLERSFVFDGDYDPELGVPVPAREVGTGTVIELRNFREPYKSECPKTAEQICLRLVEHFLLVFLQPACPKIEVIDQGIRTIANDVFANEFRSSSTTHEFEINGKPFKVHGFKLTSPRASRHRLLYAAHDRGVITENLEDYIPNLSGRLIDESGDSFVYLAVIQGSYLNQRVNNARTDFDISSGEDADADQASLFGEEIKRSEIREHSLSHVRSDLSDAIQSINSAKLEKILKYVSDEAPQYRILIRYADEFIDRISPTATRLDIDAALHRELHLREVKLKQDGSRIIKEAEKVDDYEGYHRRLADFMDRYNELGVSALAQYVAHRKIILDFLARAISKIQEKDQYPLERVVHQLIFPMGRTSGDVMHYQQNLWIVDERLTYHSFVASDKQFRSLDQFDSTSSKRPDLFIFDQKVAFTEGEQPINSLGSGPIDVMCSI